MPNSLTDTEPLVGTPGTASWAQQVSDSGYRDEQNNAAGSVTLATAGLEYPASASSTFTLTRTRRVKITVVARYQAASAAGRMIVYAGYNAGSTPVIGSVVKVGPWVSVPATAGTVGSGSGMAVGTVLLNPGTYTAYPVVNRAFGGAAGDFAGSSWVLVEDVAAL